MTQIETRTRQLRRIRRSLDLKETKDLEESVASDPDVRYNVAQNQNDPVHLPTWVQQHSTDPALEVCPHAPMDVYKPELKRSPYTGVHGQTSYPHITPHPLYT